MDKINFLDLPEENTYYIDKNKNELSFFPLQTPDYLDTELIKPNPVEPIQQLHSHLLNSLNFQLETNSFPSTLPDEINIKFTQVNLFQQVYKKTKDILFGHDSKDIAKSGINSNTIFMSTEFLSPPTDPFLKEFSEKFDSKQSLIDAIFYHEFGHIISFNHFPIIKKILEAEKLHKIPLYQVMRNFEENFSDAYASLLHKEKHNSFNTYQYIASRNATTEGYSKGFDFNINSITSSSFEKIDNMSLKSDSIDNICNKLYLISLESTLNVLKNTISKNPNFEIQLIKNLNLVGYKYNDIFKSIETLFTTQHINNISLLGKCSISDRMMSIRQHSTNQNNNTNKPTI